MKLTTTALALVLTAAASGTAYAQYGMQAPPPQNPQTAAPAQAQQQGEQPAAKPGVKPSAKAQKALVELQKAVDANDVANIPAKLAAAEAVASTKEDRYLIGQMRLKAALAAKDNAAMTAAVDVIAKSGYETPAQVAKLYSALGGNFYNAKQYEPAATALERAAALDPTNSDILLNLGETRFAQGRQADAVAIFQRAIQAKLAAGQKPDEKLYRRALSIAYDAKLPNAVELGRLSEPRQLAQLDRDLPQRIAPGRRRDARPASADAGHGGDDHSGRLSDVHPVGRRPVKLQRGADGARRGSRGEHDQSVERAVPRHDCGAQDQAEGDRGGSRGCGQDRDQRDEPAARR